MPGVTVFVYGPLAVNESLICTGGVAGMLRFHLWMAQDTGQLASMEQQSPITSARAPGRAKTPESVKSKVWSGLWRSLLPPITRAGCTDHTSKHSTLGEKEEEQGDAQQVTLAPIQQLHSCSEPVRTLTVR